MNLLLNNTSTTSINNEITITGSKSESNRLLILQQQFPNLMVTNLSNAADTQILKKALTNNKTTINIGHTGTAMRFLTAYYALNANKKIILTGSDRMKKRPIKILVDALKKLGADIEYINEIGFPPLQIKGKTLNKSVININANVSSQYITALLLIAPSLENGLQLNLKSKVTSVPYIQMTLDLLNQIGVKTTWISNAIYVNATKIIKDIDLTIESDWSSASYYYSLLALSDKGKLKLNSYKENSLQGDRNLVAIYQNFGIETTFTNKGILLEKKSNFKQKKHLTFNLINTPDIAQTIAVTCLGLGISCGLTGLHTLKIKETDRLEALKTELQKFDAKVRITNDSLHLKCNQSKINTQKSIIINTYEDHRMAMAFAPLSLKHEFTIENADVVSKSYPDFWKHFNKTTKTI